MFEHSTKKSISKNALLYMFAITFFYISSGAFSMLQGIYIKELNYGESYLGSILSIKILAMAIASMPCAYFVNNLGKKKAIILAFIFVPLMNILQGYFVDKYLIIVFSVIQGCFNSFLSVSEGPFFMENSNEENRLLLFSRAFVVNVFSTMIGYFVFGQVSKLLQINLNLIQALRYSIMLTGVIGLFSIVFVIGIEENKNSYSDHKHSLHKDFVNILKKSHPRKYMIYNFIIGFGAGLVVPYFNVYLKYKVNLNTDSIGIIMALAQGAMGIGGLITPSIAKRYGKSKAILICQCLSVPFLMLIAIPPSVTVVSLALFMRNALMNMAGPIISNISMEMVEDTERSIFSSAINISNNISRAFSAMLAGIIMNNFANGYEIPYFITAIMYIIGSTYFYKSFKELDKKPVRVSCDM